MKVANRPGKRMASNRQLLIQIQAEQDALVGFVPDPIATGESAQLVTIALGIHSDDNILSSGIIAATDED